MTGWRKFGDVAFLQVLTSEGCLKVNGGDLAHEAIAPLRPGPDGHVGDGDTVG